MATIVQSSAAKRPAIHEQDPLSTRGGQVRRGRRGIVLGLAAAGAVVIGAGAWGAATLTRRAVGTVQSDTYRLAKRSFTVDLKEKGELKAANSVDVKCEVEGRSTIISIVEEGTFVKEGDLLVELASDQLDTRIRQEELKEATAITQYEAAKTDLDVQRDQNASDIRKGELEVELKRLELQKYTEGEWGQRLRDAEILIEQAEITLERRRDDFRAAEELWEKKFITKTEYEEAEFNFKKAAWDLEKAQNAKGVLETYTHVADLRQRESDHEEAIKELERIKKNAESEERRKERNLEGKQKELAITQEELAKLRDQREKCSIVAPTQGFVVYYAGGGGRWFSSDDQIKEGATVFERQIMLQLPDTSRMQVVVRIHEAKTDKIRKGQPATVEVEGLPDHRFVGEVTKIAVVADSQNRWLNPDLKEYETEITLEPTDVPLKPGVTAHASILVEEIRDQLAVPVQSVYTKAGRRYAFRLDGSRVEPVEVGLGSLGSEWAQIVSGLAVGDQILLAFDDEHTRLVPDLPPEQNGSGFEQLRDLSPPAVGRHEPEGAKQGSGGDEASKTSSAPAADSQPRRKGRAGRRPPAGTTGASSGQRGDKTGGQG